MRINLQIPEKHQFRSFYLFFIIGSSQIAVGIINTPRLVFDEAGHDGWISIILAYFILLLLLSMMLYILKQYKNTDVLGVQTDLFGSFISKFIGTIFILYFAIHVLTTLVIYIEIVKIFVFPDISSLVVGTMLLTIIIYASLGGLRVVIGVVFLFTVFSQWLFLFLATPISQIDILHYFPIMDRKFTDIIRGAIYTAYTFTGFEILFFIYPFVKNKKNIYKPAFLGITWSAVLVLVTTIITIGFLSGEQLQRRSWPVLSLFKIQTTPIVERLDYVVIAEWMMVTIPRALLYMWCITYILKRVYNLPKKVSVIVTASVVLVILPFFTQRTDIEQLVELVTYASWALVYIYPFILLPFVVIKTKMRKNRNGEKQHENN